MRTRSPQALLLGSHAQHTAGPKRAIRSKFGVQTRSAHVLWIRSHAQYTLGQLWVGKLEVAWHLDHSSTGVRDKIALSTHTWTTLCGL